MKSMCHEARRNSPSVADCRPTFSCILTTSAIAVSSVARSCSAGMIPPQCCIETIGARPITLPLRMKSMIFASVLNCLRNSTPERTGIVLSGDCGFGTPPRPFGPWQLMQPSRT